MMTETVVNVQDASNSNNANKQTQPQGLGWIKINVHYFKTLPGILKCVQVLFGIICMATASTYWAPGTHYFLLVVALSFIITVLWIFIYLLSIREAVNQVPNFPVKWPITVEFVFTAGITAFYFTAFIVQLAIWAPKSSFISTKDANITAGVFGLFQTLLYGFGTYLLYIESRQQL